MTGVVAQISPAATPSQLGASLIRAVPRHKGTHNPRISDEAPTTPHRRLLASSTTKDRSTTDLSGSQIRGCHHQHRRTAEPPAMGRTAAARTRCSASTAAHHTSMGSAPAAPESRGRAPPAQASLTPDPPPPRPNASGRGEIAEEIEVWWRLGFLPLAPPWGATWGAMPFRKDMHHSRFKSVE
jgi:hypothetical protein